MSNILLFGAPGAGKGTQSALLVEKHHMRHLSTGDLFRAAIKNQTELGKKAKLFMDKGELVPDSIVIGMVNEELVKLGQRGFILDGFPRTVPQAKALADMLDQLGMAINNAIFLEVPQSQLLGRLTGRRVCQKCGAVFHIASRPTKVEGVCDVCGGQVIQRNDDKEDVIKTRLEAYETSTKPLKEYYREAGKLTEIDGLGDSMEVFSRLEKTLNFK